MSSGSFNYLHAADSRDLAAGRFGMELSAMAADLDGRDTPEAHAAWVKTRALITQILLNHRLIDERMKELAPVFKAVEWERSADRCAADTAEVLRKWAVEG